MSPKSTAKRKTDSIIKDSPKKKAKEDNIIEIDDTMPCSICKKSFPSSAIKKHIDKCISNNVL